MLVPKEKMAEFWPMINQIMFFITYTVFRVFLFPYVTYLAFYDYYNVWSIVALDRKLASLINCLTWVSVLLLNIYWYALILKGLKKLIQGAMKKNSKSDDDYIAA